MDTDRFVDIYLEVAPSLEKIMEAEYWKEVVKIAQDGVTGGKLLSKLLTDVLPLVLKYNRQELYHIIGVVNGKSAEDVAKQPFAQTISEARALLTTDFGDLFTSTN